ncbi:MAG: ArsA family ATPase [Desulfotomaculales bacterium]
MRSILYTGKGGVGKTTVAAATAVRAAALGYRTVVMSTDIAHSLADAFDRQLGPVPTEVTRNLWAQEIDVRHELQVHWKTVREWLAALFRWRGLDAVVAEELAVLPGMEELVSLLHVGRYARRGDVDVLVVDCAPTGETFRLLSFPEVARWYMRHVFPIERKIVGTVAPLVRRTFGVPLPGEEVFSSVEALYRQLEEMREVLLNSAHSSVRLVVNPEKMVVKEAQRSFTYLNLYGYQTDLVVCNRLFPEGFGGDFLAGWREAQAQNLRLVEEAFAPVPVLKAPLMRREVVGLSMLEEFSEALFGSADPTRFFYAGRPQKFRKEGERIVLRVRLPFTSREELRVLEDGRELVLEAGRWRRNFLLPDALAGYAVEGAVFESGHLRIVFVPKKVPRGENGGQADT